MTLPSLQAVRVPEDDWSGLASAAERRKLQNKLNQRIYRKRRSAKPSPPTNADDGAKSEHLNTSTPDRRRARSSKAISDKGWNITSVTGRVKSVHDLDAKGVRELMIRYERSIHQEYLQCSPRADQLLTLIQFNVFRALIDNGVAVGFSMDWLEESAVSPWYVCAGPSPASTISSTDTNPKPTPDVISDDEESTRRSTSVAISPPISLSSSTSALSVPRYLHPSALQRTIPHHPWIDLFPFPQMRDNLLVAGVDASYDEWALCNDLVDFCDVTHDQTGLIVWREPWDPSGWEVSESFLRKWAWVVRGCEELVLSTNR